MFDVFLVILVGFLLIGVGILNLKGNLKTLHSYHYKRVREVDKKVFCKLVGSGTLIIGCSIFVSSILLLVKYFTAVAVLEHVAMGFSITGLVVGLAICFYAMFKYNKGIF